MRLSPLLAVAGLAGVAYAFDSLIVGNYNNDNNIILKYATEIPVCANICIFQAAIAVGCQTNDYHCQCSQKRLQLYTLTQNCLAKSCNRHQSKRAYELTNNICDAVAQGVRNPDIQLPPPPPPPTPPIPEADIPEQVVDFPFPVWTEDPIIMRRGLPGDVRMEKRTASFVASSIPSSIVPGTATATSPPTTVATAGAALLQAPAAFAGIVAVAGAALLV